MSPEIIELKRLLAVYEEDSVNTSDRPESWLKLWALLEAIRELK